MIVDDSIVMKYLSGENPDSYKENWIYKAHGRGNLFETPNPSCKEWVLKLCDKMKTEIKNFTPRNYDSVKKIFPCFDDVARDYTIMLVVGFPDPYDAMAMINNDGAECMVFDLIQFGQGALDGKYNCYCVLTHELIHICLHKTYQKPAGLSYREDLDYLAFDEGFAHALPYPEDINAFRFDDFLEEKYEQARKKLRLALAETDSEKQKAYLISADTGNYWDKYGAISAKLYILKNIHNLAEIYNGGGKGFAERILDDTERGI